jgi:hypothetical protein
MPIPRAVPLCPITPPHAPEFFRPHCPNLMLYQMQIS